MGEIVNLRTVRKQVKRRDAEERAASNRLMHGRRKADRLLDKAQRDKEHDALEQHRLDNENPQ
jgi:hypothetical protein